MHGMCASHPGSGIACGHLRLCLRSHVEANGRHSSVHPAVARLLAAAQNHLRPGNARALALSFWKLCVEKWPLFIMAAISSVITFIAQRAGGAVAALQTLPLWAENLQRGHQLLPLCADYVLARSAHRLLLPRVNNITIAAAVLSTLRSSLLPPSAGISARKSRIASSAGCGSWELWCR